MLMTLLQRMRKIGVTMREDALNKKKTIDDVCRLLDAMRNVAEALRELDENERSEVLMWGMKELITVNTQEPQRVDVPFSPFISPVIPDVFKQTPPGWPHRQEIIVYGCCFPNERTTFTVSDSIGGMGGYTTLDASYIKAIK
jgi:hypothetical protein